jgi:hypothetical protein
MLIVEGFKKQGSVGNGCLVRYRIVSIRDGGVRDEQGVNP